MPPSLVEDAEAATVEEGEESAEAEKGSFNINLAKEAVDTFF